MNRQRKSELVDDLTQRLSRSPNLYLTDFTGIAVKPMTDLRRRLRSAGIEYVVVKNTLALRALQAASVEGVGEMLSGPTGFVFCGEDAVGAAKVIAEFQKEHELLTVKAGMLNRWPVSASDVKALASLPARGQLLAELGSVMQAPLQGFVGAVDGLLYQMVGVLGALAAQRATAEPQV